MRGAGLVEMWDSRPRLSDERSSANAAAKSVNVRNAFERRGDRGIVGSGGGEGFLRQPPFGFERECAVVAGEFFGDGWVVGRGGDHGDIVKILGGGADHGGSADVDVLDQLFKSHAGLGSGFFKRVEIHDDHVDRLDAVFGDGCDVRGVFAAMQNAAVNFGMQRLDAPIEHFRKAGEFGDVFDGDAGIAQQLGGASGGDEFDAEAGELAGEIYEAGFIGDAEDGALDAGMYGTCEASGMKNECVRTEDSISNP